MQPPANLRFMISSYRRGQVISTRFLPMSVGLMIWLTLSALELFHASSRSEWTPARTASSSPPNASRGTRLERLPMHLDQPGRLVD